MLSNGAIERFMLDKKIYHVSPLSKDNSIQNAITRAYTASLTLITAKIPAILTVIVSRIYFLFERVNIYRYLHLINL